MCKKSGIGQQAASHHNEEQYQQLMNFQEFDDTKDLLVENYNENEHPNDTNWLPEKLGKRPNKKGTKTSKTVDEREKNIKVHKGKKKYNCESCDKSFSRASDLKGHIHGVHEGHEDYKCELCGKSFSHAGDLKRHILTIHEGHKDYKCESCGKSFSQETNLNDHKIRIHNWCKYCDEVFGNKLKVTEHLKTIHLKI